MDVDWDVIPELILAEVHTAEAMELRRRLIEFIMDDVTMQKADTDALSAACYTIWLTLLEAGDVCLACVFDVGSATMEHTCQVN